MTTTVRIGIIGYGYAAATFHAPLILGTPGLALTTIATRDAGKVRAALPGVAVEASPEALVMRPDLDLVVIPTPNETHFALASLALRAGKHVVVDKPFTITLAEAIALQTLSEQSGRLLSVFHNRRWDSDFLTLRRVLDSKVLGRIVQVESRFDRYRLEVKPRWRERPGAGAGLWYDLGPHLLDQMVQLFGMPEAIQLDLARQREGASVDDWFHAVLTYGSLRAILQAGTLVPAPGARFTMHGDKGSFLKQGLDPQEAQLKAGQCPPRPEWGEDPVPAVLTLRDGEAVTERLLPCEPGNYLAYYEGVRDAVLGRGPNPVTAEQGIQVMDLLERGHQSAAEHRRIAMDQR